MVGNQQGHAIEAGEERLRLEDAMSVESILRRKGTDVATIVPDASVKRAADWLHAKNIGALVVTRGDAVLGRYFPNVRSFTRFLATARLPHRCL